MFQKNEFKAALARSEKTMTEVAESLEINVATLSVKANGRREFTNGEIEKLMKCLDLNGEDLLRIFFAEEASDESQ